MRKKARDRCERTRRRALLLGDGRAVDAFGASKDETESKDVIVTFQAGLHELGEKMLTKKQEREEMQQAECVAAIPKEEGCAQGWEQGKTQRIHEWC